VVFLVAGDDRTVYGGDSNYLGGKTLKQVGAFGAGFVRSQSIKFLGTVPPATLARCWRRRIPPLSHLAVRAELEH